MFEKTDQHYWETQWASDPLPPPIFPERDTLRNLTHHEIHKFLSDALQPFAHSGSKLLEFGCARSLWLPYFSRHLGFSVTGLDYTENGCALARSILAREGVEGRIVQADFLTEPAADLRASFHAGFSFGVVEHFDDTAACLKALAQFIAPGGLLVTIIPNMAGLVGTAQKLINRAIYDVHVPLDLDALMSAHREAGLVVSDARYLVPVNFGVLNPGTERTLGRKLGSAVRLGLMAASFSAWCADRMVPLPRRRAMAPYIACAARKSGV